MLAFPSQIGDFLRSRHTMAIATYSDEKHAPQIATIYYLFLDNELYIVARPTTSKIKNILSNGKLALVITDEDVPETLQIEAKAQLILEKNQMESILASYTQMTGVINGKVSPALEIPGNTLVVLKVIPVWFRFTNFSEQVIEAKA